MKRKVLIFSLAYYPKLIGGAEVALKEITDRADINSFDFDLITIFEGSQRQERMGNINVFRVGYDIKWPLAKYYFIFSAYRKARILHKENKYQVIWSIMANYAGFSALFFKKKFPNISFLLTLQEGDPVQYIRRRVGIIYPLFKEIFTYTDHIQVISNFLKDWAISMGVKKDNISVIPNGVREDFFRIISSEERNSLRKSMDFKITDRIIITSSRLVLKNAVDNIIRALPLLSSEYKLLIAGDGVEKDSLLKLAQDLHVSERVKFLGFIDHKELPTYLQSSDVFVRTSRSEGLGNSFLEAMAAGIPVVATPVGGIPDFLKDGENGLFCEIDNPSDLAQRIEVIMKDKDMRSRILDSAKSTVRDLYNWHRISDDIKTAVLKMVQQVNEVK
jgi:glycosyltransferase involved in cell wall biosynthesis